MSFHSFYWIGTILDNSRDQQAVMELTNAETTLTRKLDALQTLLRSQSTPSQCIALDQYSYSQSQERHGYSNPFEVVEELVRERTLDQLDTPPYVRTEVGASPRVGANHASAFHAMRWLAHIEDAERLVGALRQNIDPDVILEGIEIAEGLLYDESDPFLPLVDLMKEFALRDELPVELRAVAVRAVGVVSSDSFDSFLIKMTELSQLEISAASTRCLAERDVERYRPLLQTVVNSWPDTYISYDAAEVRDLLKE